MENEEKRKEVYEIGYFLKITQQSDGTPPNNFLLHALGELGAETPEVTSLVEKRLAYPIKKERVGLWGVVKFILDPEKLTELKSRLKNEDILLRYLITKAVPATQRTKKPLRRPYPKRETLLHPAEKPAGAQKPTGEQKPTVKLEELEKKLEELLEG